MATTQSSTIHAYCSLGHNVNHSCRQCLARTLTQWGYDAQAYDQAALKETNKKRTKVWRQLHPERKGDPYIAHQQRFRAYGITAEQYRALLKKQQGICALCAKPETSMVKGTRRSLSVDHDHATGRIRGLLCLRCNRTLADIEALGMVWAHAAHDYLTIHQALPDPVPTQTGTDFYETARVALAQAGIAAWEQASWRAYSYGLLS